MYIYLFNKQSHNLDILTDFSHLKIVVYMYNKHVNTEVLQANILM